MAAKGGRTAKGGRESKGGKVMRLPDRPCRPLPPLPPVAALPVAERGLDYQGVARRGLGF